MFERLTVFARGAEPLAGNEATVAGQRLSPSGGCSHRSTSPRQGHRICSLWGKSEELALDHRFIQPHSSISSNTVPNGSMNATYLPRGPVFGAECRNFTPFAVRSKIAASSEETVKAADAPGCSE